MVKEQEKLLKELNTLVQVFKSSEGAIRPHFILTGPSGSGKSHTIESLAEQFEINYLEINAAQLTKEGTAGNSLSKALAPLADHQNSMTLCFVDEFDKLFISGNGSEGAHETTTGVQNEFLKVLECDYTSVYGQYGHYNKIDISNVLFVFAGAFNGAEDLTLDKLRDYGLKTEFLGRVGLLFQTEKLSVESMMTILSNSKTLKDYLTLFPSVKKDEVVSCLKEHIVANYEKNTLGIRMMSNLVHQYFIKGKDFGKEQVKKSTFQNTLELK
jgi:ATP-dependent protease Clp ATPase subunit